MELIWSKIPIKESEVCLSKVLRCGQTFRWKNINNVWTFSTSDRIILLKQDSSNIYYSQIMSHQNKSTTNDTKTIDFINDYLTLDIKLEKLYTQWKANHEPYKHKSSTSPFDSFTGIRTLRQDPWECLICFICSSNNNVKRISKMCDNLCVNFGNYINDYQGHSFYSFPTPKQLSGDDVETKLRNLGFGYRASYIYKTAKMFTNDEQFPNITLTNLNELRNKSYEESHAFLIQLCGVGPKVADCICLMSLDKSDIVPIDTHIYQIAIRDFKFKGKKDLKTLNLKLHSEIRQFFKNIFGDYAGWAQSVLFAADLSDLNNGINDVEPVKEEIKSIKNEVVKVVEKNTNKRKILSDVETNIKVETGSKKIKVSRSVKVEV
ncbi:OGG1 [Candida pseudojiufengensis]|uniref:OGG1 n=1 Tax=Candida pseudojiufengensis TaxID=497109 RepID=UPI0022251549|nr:OGG1 [Candida pseudojiufengensis]KAI5959819.1 OGG1 [Candida pseudojiufengensis]